MSEDEHLTKAKEQNSRNVVDITAKKYLYMIDIFISNKICKSQANDFKE